ncbi:ABC-2 transporter permease [Lachnospiraceae bacterium KK002]
MKGLLIKDFRLMKGQKNFFFVIVVISVGMAAFSEDLSFMMSFLPFVLSLFTLSTISYDEFDNGNAFLFTLPVSRAGYTIEKYCLALLLGGGAWVLSVLLAMGAVILRETASLSETVMMAVMMLPPLIVIQAVMIPFQLKFGGEKGRIALIGVFGLLSVIGIAAVKAARMFRIDIEDMLGILSAASMGTIVAALMVIAVILLLISVKISISIMKNKEF